MTTSRTKRKAAPEVAGERLRDPGYTPPLAEVPALLDRLGDAENAERDAIEKALVRAGPAAARVAIRRASEAAPRLRARLVRAVGRIASRFPENDLREVLAAALGDPDARTRKNAAAALGRLRHADSTAAEAALLAAVDAERDASTRAAIIEALGKVGGPKARDAFAREGDHHGDTEGTEGGGRDSRGRVGGPKARDAFAREGDHHGDTEGTEGGGRNPSSPSASSVPSVVNNTGIPASDDAVARASAKARLLLERTLARATPSRFLADRPVAGPTPVVVRCRAGLESILCDELDRDLSPSRVADAFGDEGRVAAVLTGPPSRLFAARTMLDFAFPLPAARVAPAPRGALEAGADAALEEALASALASDDALAILSRFTVGPIRYRLAWARGGKRRALVFRLAERVARARPELVNDPTRSPWTAVVHEAPAKAGAPRLVRVELVPTVGDPRFSYRQGDVPAASHPTIAAALARLAGAGPNDVVWDPFVGSGLELCERSLLGPSRRLLGTDLDVAALDVARENLRAAGARSFELVRADALAFRPAERPSVILTNPPMGRRVHRSADLGALLERFVAHAAAVLAPDRGRLVWITPMPDRTGAAARRAGLSPQFERDVDMGGFRARMQVLTAARRRA